MRREVRWIHPLPHPVSVTTKRDRFSEGLDQGHLVDGGCLHKQMSYRAKQSNDDAGNGCLVRPVAYPRHEVFGVTHRRQGWAKDDKPQHEDTEHRKSAEEDGPPHKRLRRDWRAGSPERSGD